MKWFKNLKIGIKLISSFICVAIITGIVGIVAVTNLKELNDRDTFMYEKTTLPLAYLANMSSDFQRIRVNCGSIALSDNKQDIEGFIGRIKGFNEKFRNNSKLCEKTYINQDDEREHKSANENYLKFYDYVEQLCNLALENKMTEVKTFLKGEMLTQGRATQDVLDKIIVNNIETAKKTNDENTVIANSTVRLMIITTVIVFIIAIILGIFISKLISNPVKKLEQTAIKVSEGNLNVNIDIYTSDELGSLANAFRLLVTNFQNLIKKIIKQTETINKESEELSSISNVAASASAELQAQAQTASSSSEQISANVSTVSSSAEEMTASIKEISKNTTAASSLTKESEDRANDASKVMNRLGKSSQEIGNIVKSITTIAEQTNLLALNATIEAARAGESGKGFAVVANEVKELAKEAAKATEDITGKIKMIQEDSDNAIGVIKGIIENATKVNEVTNSIASAIEEQSVTTNEINRNLAEASKGVQSIVEVISGITMAANDYAKQATTIKTTSGSLKSLSNECEKEIKTNFKF